MSEFHRVVDALELIVNSIAVCGGLEFVVAARAFVLVVTTHFGGASGELRECSFGFGFDRDDE